MTAEFEYDGSSRLSAFRQLQTSIPEDDQGYTKKLTEAKEVHLLTLFLHLSAADGCFSTLCWPAFNITCWQASPGWVSGMSTMQAKDFLLKASPFKSLEALLEVFMDLEAGTGVMYVVTQPQPKRDALIPCEVDGIKDIKDQETGETLRSYLTQAYLTHKAFRQDQDTCSCLHAHITASRQCLHESHQLRVLQLCCISNENV